ncbi:DNA replication and repair protein RecF [uncultured Arcticibacterium sp.]|uniref:DNA replication/repair protein RecF n=1 Tax=uncultured Arcticibacterium sp. TaxID=2173042 RepID=UPI0030FB3C77
MYLKSIRLFNFRNHTDAQFQFSERVNCIVGQNGGGKTNLIDAVYFLALTKSSIQKQDQLSVTHDELIMVIDGNFVNIDKEENITLSVRKGQKKTLLADKVAYDRLTEHIGKYPVVLIAPDDTDMIRDASDTRRKLFDGIISQFDMDYLKAFQKYNRLMDQRNSLLKQFAEREYFDQEMLDSYSQPLVALAIEIANKRRSFLGEFEPEIVKHYKEISGGKEKVSIHYQSEVEGDFAKKFKHNEFRDRQAQRTTLGIHKDDYVFQLDELPAKKFGSQGQKKSVVLSVRLAQFNLLEARKGLKPILLLDDIFDKLDDNRIKKLIEKIDNDTFGQVFITDARPERTQRILENVKAEVKYIEL